MQRDCNEEILALHAPSEETQGGLLRFSGSFSCERSFSLGATVGVELQIESEWCLWMITSDLRKGDEGERSESEY
jgi:hypothetical protein